MGRGLQPGQASLLVAPGAHRQASVDYWNAVAPIYDRGAGHSLRNVAERRAWAVVLSECLPRPPARFLDLGTGTGFLAYLLNDLGYEVVGIDLSSSMLSVAQARVTRSNMTVTLLNGDVSDLPFKDASFDGVLSRYVLWSLPHPEASLAEWCRVCRAGSMVMAIDGQWWQNRWDARLQHGLGRVLEWWHERNEPPTPWPQLDDYYTTELRESLPLRSQEDPQGVVNLFQRAGLESVQLKWLHQVRRVEKELLPLRRRLRYQPKFLVTGKIGEHYAG